MSLACLAGAASLSDTVCAGVPNRQYSLKGARYQLYTDEECTIKAKDVKGRNAILITDENGDSDALEMEPGTYYARETRPGKGYKPDTEADGSAKIYTINVTAANTESDPATFTSREPPLYGEPDFMVIKTTAAGSFDHSQLAGAKFTVKYYDVESREEIAGARPKDEWTFEAVRKDGPDGTYIAGFDWQHDYPVSYSRNGKGVFYEVDENGETKRVLPLGWFTVEETAAPPGFMLSGKVFYGHVYQPSGGDEAITEIEGADGDTGQDKVTLTFADQPYPRISTAASMQDGNHVVEDLISYEYLLPDTDYVFRGWLVDTATGEKVPGSDGTVELRTGSETSGQIPMILSTEGYEDMEGHSMTVFEELYAVSKDDGEDTETLAAEHKDLNDGSQTVEIYQDLKIGKNVSGNLGDLSKVFSFTAEFTGLVPGEAYTVEGFDEKVFNADQSGEATIPLKLKDDESVAIRQLPKGAGYRITEEASEHVSEFKAYSEDMEDNGAKIEQASGSNSADVEAALSTAPETVDMYDGTVVIAWENRRDLATVTAVQTYLGIWALALAIVTAGTSMLLIKHTKYKKDWEEKT